MITRLEIDVSSAFRKTTLGVAAVATAGVSTLFVGSAPAGAAVDCGVGNLIAPGVCELRFTSNGQFIPTTDMTKLEALLVGAGGSGVNPAPATTGYAAAGGGGEVKLVDFSTSTSPITVTVPTPTTPGGATDGTIVGTVINGGNGVSFATPVDVATGGPSGSGNAGWNSVGSEEEPPFASGGGDTASPTSAANGGAGTIVSSIAAAGSLFATDASCYGGGGAVGQPTISGHPRLQCRRSYR